MNDKSETKSIDLRRMAEDSMGASPDAPSGDPEHVKLRHELGVHRAELEIQNEQLRESQIESDSLRTRYKDLFEFAPVGYLRLDRSGRILEANLTFCAMVGFERKFIGERSLTSFVSQADLPVFGQQMKALEKSGVAMACELIMQKRDGSPFDARIELSSAVNSGTNEILAAVSDISDHRRIERERLEIEEKLRQSQKLEAIGLLAGGVAHDFNNLLAVIMGNSEVGLRKVGRDSPGGKEFGHIIAASDTAREMTMKLLTFARRDVIDPEVVELSGVVENVVSMTKRLIPKNIDLEHACSSGLYVKMDSGQMIQALLNMCVNARDAMPEGGTLRIRSREATPSEENPTKRILPGRYCLIEVADTGVGIPEGVKQKVFEPFFTTKEMGHGTGLGLSIAKGIIDAHGGHIDIDSRAGVGTTIMVYLPLTEELGLRASDDEAVRGGSETILLIDDDAPVLNVMSVMLSEAGYNVLTADCGRKGVDIYKEQKDSISAVLLDFIMPGMDGDEVYHALKRIDPGVRVIFSSGFSVEGRMSELMKSGASGFVQKPFSSRRLCEVVRHAIDATAGSARNHKSA